LCFINGTDAIQTVVCERPEQAGATDHGNAIGVIAELDEQVQHALRHRPAEG